MEIFRPLLQLEMKLFHPILQLEVEVLHLQFQLGNEVTEMDTEMNVAMEVKLGKVSLNHDIHMSW